MLKRLSSIAKKSPKSGDHNHRGSFADGVGTVSSSSGQQSAPPAGRGGGNMLFNAPRRPSRRRRTDDNAPPEEEKLEDQEQAEDFHGSGGADGADERPMSPPTYEEAFGNPIATSSGDNVGLAGQSKDKSIHSSSSSSSLLHQSSSLFKRNNSFLQSGEASNKTNRGIEHVAIVRVRSDATPDQIEAFLDAAKSLAHLVDGVLSLSVGKIFVDNTFMVDNSHGIASQGGYAMRVLLRDMDAYKGWVENKARKAFVIEFAVPLMPQGTVPMVVAFESEEALVVENSS